MQLDGTIQRQGTGWCEFHSPVAHKVTVVKTVQSQAEALSFSGVERVQEEKEVTGALKENGNQSSFVYKHSYLGRSRLDREVRT